MSTLHISLIPILGVLSLIALSIYVQTRRSSRVAEVKALLEQRRQQILRADAQNDQLLIDNLLGGISVDRSLAQFLSERTKLLPGANPEAPAAWTLDQLEDWARRERHTGIEHVNRTLALPAFATALVIVAVCVVTAAVLYQFHSGIAEPVPPPQFTSTP